MGEHQMEQRMPAEVFPPGEFLRDELEERSWTQSDLAEIIGRPVGLINEIITGKRGISPETAQGLSAALGTSAELWLNLDSAYQLSRVRNNDGGVISRRAKLYNKAPVKEMIRRGWIEPSENITTLESQVLRFLEIGDIDDEPEEVVHTARKATSYQPPISSSQRAWLFRARQLARSVQVAKFNDQSLGELVERLRLLLRAPHEIRHIPRLLAEAGIRFVVVQPLQGNKVDGACFWINNEPVIAMTVRFDRIDNFWFVLMHELGHVKHGVQSLDIDLDNAGKLSNRPQEELAADAFAAEQIVPSVKIESFINRVRPLYSVRRIEAFATTMGVHPGVVVGQLQHRGEVPYSSLRKTMIPIRDIITASALTDGWGATLPANL